MGKCTKRRKLELSLSNVGLDEQSYSSKNPYLVFPEELWLQIICHIKNQYTLQTIFSAFPEFSSIFGRYVNTLQFSQVSSRVFEYQPPLHDDLSISQLVTKNWCTTICNFLDENPVIKAPQLNTSSSSTNELKISVKQIVPKRDFQYFIPKENIELQAPLTFSSTTEVQNFHQSLILNPASSKVTLPSLRFVKDYSIHSVRYLEACIALFFEFGYGVQNVTLDFDITYFPTNIDAEAFFQGIVKCLEYLPNVRTLSLGITALKRHGLSEIIANFKQFPEMPFLEKLEIRSTSKMQYTLLQYFVNGGYLRRRPGIKRLILPVCKESKFQCLVEYQLARKCGSKSVSAFRKFLKCQKRKIAVVKPQPGRMCQCLIRDLFRWLAEEKHAVEELIVDNTKFKILCPISQNIPTLPSVKYLKITDSSTTGFQFLSALPSLEWLHVQCRQETKSWFVNGDALVNEPLSSLVRNYLYLPKVPKECNIWEELPSLKSLVVEDEGILSKHFVRRYKNKPVIFKHSIPLVDLG